MPRHCLRPSNADPCAFEQLFTSLVAQADTRLWSGLDARVGDNLNEAARASLRLALLRELSSLGTAALYERFAKARNAGSPQHDAAGPAQHNGTSRYDRFVAEMQAGGWRRLFEDKPVLLRLIATMTRQWIDTSREMVLRLDADLAVIRRDILHSGNAGRVAGFEGNLSDPHNQRPLGPDRQLRGRRARRLQAEGFAARCRLARLGRALERRSSPVRAQSRARDRADGYGWTEFIDHAACADAEAFARFFRRAGGWLALFHCFAATDMHQENMIACGDHPVPIDLEMILQAGAEERSAEAPEDRAFAAAAEIVSNSVMAVGLLPAYGRSPDNNRLCRRRHDGGLERQNGTHVGQNQFRRDAAGEIEPSRPRPAPICRMSTAAYAKFGDHVDDFVAGFEQYAKFLVAPRPGRRAGRAVRRICRRSGPQRRSCDPILLHAAAAAAQSQDHGRRRDLVGASRFHRQAVRLAKRASIRCGRCSGPNARRWLRSTCRISFRPATATTSAMRAALLFMSRCPRASIVPGCVLRISTSGRSPGRSRSSARIQTRSRVPPSPKRRSYKKRVRQDSASRRQKRLSPPKPIGSRRNCRITPYAAARASPGSVSIGWAIPSFLSSCASVRTSTTAFAASVSFLRPMRR